MKLSGIEKKSLKKYFKKMLSIDRMSRDVKKAKMSKKEHDRTFCVRACVLYIKLIFEK